MKAAPRALTWSWLGLLGLLGLTVTLAYQPLGAFNGLVALTIAALKVLIVAAVFMELRQRDPLTCVFAGAGICWLAVLLWLASTDFKERPPEPLQKSVQYFAPYSVVSSGTLSEHSLSPWRNRQNRIAPAAASDNLPFLPQPTDSRARWDRS